MNKTTFLMVGLLGLSFLTKEVKAQNADWCDSHSRTNEILQSDPEARKRVQELEKFTQEYTLKSMKSANQADKIIIPIVFHVIHTGGPENITVAQIEDAVRIINRDYSKQNADTAQVLNTFQPIIGNPQFEFRLARLDPNGNCTNGITRTYSDFHKGADDAQIKSLISWDSQKYLNVYCVSNIASGAGAYAYLPGSWPVGSNRDGIVCRVSQLGSIGQSGSSNLAERTLTHEIGHYFNLRHTWGPTNTPGLASNCDVDDDVEDTPNTVGMASQNCNKAFTSCGGILANVENYMDYSSCERMFTLGQVARMTAAANGTAGGRQNLWKQANLIATGTNDGFVPSACKPLADFYREPIVCSDVPVQFNDASWRSDATAWEWTFEGATPATSADQNPSVTYSTPGVYTVKLKVSNSAGADSITRTNFIRVVQNVSTIPLPLMIDMEDAQAISNSIINLNGNTKDWERVTNAGFGSSSSLAMKFFGVSDGQANSFVTPTINLVGTTSPMLKFKYAYAQRTGASLDQLKISVSRNCAVTYSNLFQKSGADLATTTASTSSFVPTNNNQWKQESISLNNYLTEDNALFRFTATNSGPGSNIYIDDLSIDVATGMEQFVLNNLNLRVAPNPFSSTANVSFTIFSDSKVTVSVYDLLGKKVADVLTDNLNSGEYKIELNESNTGIRNSGIYFLKVNVNGLEKVEKIMIQK